MKRLDSAALPLDGVVLIEASAGTGKTYTIETLFLRLLLERGLSIERILVVTYTNAAAAELRTRIRTRILAAQQALAAEGPDGDEDWRALLRARRERGCGDGDRLALLRAACNLDQAAILTIHAFCQRVLQELAFHSGAAYGTQLISDQTALLDEVVRDFWVRELYAAPQAVVRARRGELATLRDLARRAVAQPDLALVPAAREVPPLAELLDGWEAMRRRAAALLAADPDGIAALLRQSKAVRSDRITAWTEQLAADLRAPTGFTGRGTAHLERYSSRADNDKRPPPAPFFDACADLHERETALLDGFKAQRLALRHRLVDFVRRELGRRKEESNVAYFDDLLQRVAEALRGPRGAALADELRRRYPAALIDEFQDTDPAQCEIFARVYVGETAGEASALFLVGDPKQAIYGFRGADVFAYTRAKSALAGEERSLVVNRRSAELLVQAVNAVFARAKRTDGDDFLVAGIEFDPVEPCADPPPPPRHPAWGPLRFLLCPNDDSKPLSKEEARRRIQAGVVAEIARLLAAPPRLKEGPLRPRDIAVLCRTNVEAATMQNQLRELGIPTVLRGDASVLDSNEAVEMERVLRAMAAPRDAAAVRAALATSMIGCDARELYELREGDAEPAADLRGAEPAAVDWRAWFREWHALWEKHGFMPAFRRMLEQARAPEKLLALSDGERRLTNVLHLGELLQAAGHDERRGPLALVEWLGLMREDASRRAEMATDAAQIRLERDEHALVLTTIHKSKGLQFPVVFCPFLWDGRLPDRDELCTFHDTAHGDRRSLDLEPEAGAHLGQSHLELLAENMRLLYVALTRAESACAVVWGRFRSIETSALGYVLHHARDPGGDVVARTQQRISGLSEEAMRAELQQLADAVPGAIEIAPLRDTPCPRYAPEARPDPDTLNARVATCAFIAPWRVSSFSALVADRVELSEAAREGLDRDELARPEGVAAAGDAAQRRIRLADLPAGTRTGLMIHKILELIDFRAVDGEEQRRTIAREVARFGLERRWRDVVGEALRDVVDTPLPAAATFRLRDVERRRRIDEMEFVFPIGAAAGGRSVDAAALADVLARHGAPRGAPEYARRLGELGFAELAGFLRGYIDLVFEHGGRWYVVDYKSNLLGVNAADYSAEALRGEMVASHYVLQYHLYVVAVHRFLAARLRAYDYERDFGGVFYLFLRGMAAENPEPWGIFADRPSRELVEDLSGALSPPRAPEAGR